MLQNSQPVKSYTRIRFFRTLARKSKNQLKNNQLRNNLFCRTEDSEMNENSQRHRIEIADFGGIEWKIQNIHLSKELKRFLVSL